MGFLKTLKSSEFNVKLKSTHRLNCQKLYHFQLSFFKPVYERPLACYTWLEREAKGLFIRIKTGK